MTKSVWITRTNPAASESAPIWRAAGFDPIVSPVLNVQPVEHDVLSQDTVVIFTSKNGVDHYVGACHRAICVGDATADRARAAGYINVVSVDGTSRDIADWVLKNLPTSQPICHVSGWHIRGRIAEDLKAAGYPATRLKTYRSHPEAVWPSVPFTHVALYSPMAAQVFAETAGNRDISTLTAVCISENTAQALSELSLKSVSISTQPREDALIQAALG